VLGIFEIRSREWFAWGWLQNVILLISTSQVARITGVRHQHPAYLLIFLKRTFSYWSTLSPNKQSLFLLLFLKRCCPNQVLVAHTFNPGYLGCRDWEDHGCRPVQIKEFAGYHLNGKELGVVVCTCHPNYNRKHKIGGSPSRWAGTKSETLSEN
jgi:hypothetical protein